MLERRTHRRTRSFAVATLGCGSARAELDCVVRDLSDGGALLLLDEPRRAPSETVLSLRGNTRRARVVWRCATGVGVSFDAPALHHPRSAAMVCLDAVRRERVGDDRRLAERIARFVRHPGGARP